MEKIIFRLRRSIGELRAGTWAVGSWKMFTPVVRRYARYALEYPYIISNDIFAVNEISRDFTVVKFKIDEFFLFFFWGRGSGNFSNFQTLSSFPSSELHTLV